MGENYSSAAQLVREEVERTVLDPAEVEAELHGLCEALVQAEGLRS